MTQTIAQPATPPAVAPAPAPAPVHRRGLRGALSRTPGKMRVAGVLAIVASLAVGVLGLRAGLAQSDALADADADTTQLVGIQDVRNDLVVADATATNAFLVGGLEPPAQRARYDEAVASAASGLDQPRVRGQAGGRLAQQLGVCLVGAGQLREPVGGGRDGLVVPGALLRRLQALSLIHI